MQPSRTRLFARTALAALLAPMFTACANLPDAAWSAPSEATTVAAPETTGTTPAALPSPDTRADLARELLAKAPGLTPEVLDRALAAHACAVKNGILDGGRPSRLTVIDYSLPSTEKRLWVFDLEERELLFHEFVAHGEGSGANVATAFSNTSDSHQSSLGVFRTAETYVGKHGRSLRLDGLEPGFNDRARDRAIVVHGADYVSDAFVKAHGRLGRSWGCPAVSKAVSDRLIDAIAGGSLVFAYHPQDDWLGSSKYLNCGS